MCLLTPQLEPGCPRGLVCVAAIKRRPLLPTKHIRRVDRKRRKCVRRDLPNSTPIIHDGPYYAIGMLRYYYFCIVLLLLLLFY